MEAQPVPLLNVWSGYSLLRSLWDMERGVGELYALGYRQVGLADFHSLAGAELFDRTARAAGLAPWLGVTLEAAAGAAVGIVRVYALDPAGWGRLCATSGHRAPVPVEQLASPHVMLCLTGDWWQPVADSLAALGFGLVVQEVEAGRRAWDRLAAYGWHWVPDWPVRYHSDEDQAAYRALAKLGTDGVSGPAKAPVAYTQWLTAARGDPDRLLRWPAPARVLPDSAFKLPRVVEDGETAETMELTRRARVGLAARLGSVPDAYGRRLGEELAIIATLGFAGYFLVVEDLVREADRRKIRRGPGRGSAAGSLVAYALGITDVDPLAHGLIFERFLNPARRTMPDIDLDFDYERRPELVAYLRQRWGRDRVAQIGTYGSFGARAALRDAGRALGHAPGEIARVMDRLALEHGSRLDDVADAIWDAMSGVEGAAAWFDTARRLEGLPRHASVHAAGVVIGPDRLTEKLPCWDDGAGNLVTQMEMGSVERLGYLKLDVLGLRTLTVLTEIERIAGLPETQMASVDAADAKTLRLLGRGETDGVFQLDGRGVRELLRQMQPRHLDDIMAVVALYRPGPMDAIRTFLFRREHPEAVPAGDPVAELCADTYGVMVYQEQLMRIVRDLAGYSFAEADMFRRAISKKDRELLDRGADDLRRRLVARGMSPADAERLWQAIVAFADFGFNKSHAAAYGLLSYYMAYLKAHYPLAFWCAELGSLTAHDKLEQEMSQAVASGIVVRPPAINQSGVGFAVEGEELRAGLTIVRGIGREAAHSLVDERDRHGMFQSFADFWRRVGNRLGHRTVETLRAAGVLRELAGADGQAGGSDQLSLFEDSHPVPAHRPTISSFHSFGLNWPEATGPVYVKIGPRADVEAMAARAAEVARRYPGTVPVVVALPSGRGRPIAGATMDGRWPGILALKEIEGVWAAARQVVKQKEIV